MHPIIQSSIQACPARMTIGNVGSVKMVAYTMKRLTNKEYVVENLLIKAENMGHSRPLTHLPVIVD